MSSHASFFDIPSNVINCASKPSKRMKNAHDRVFIDGFWSYKWKAYKKQEFAFFFFLLQAGHSVTIINLGNFTI